jgi:hypothetical protein
MTNTNAGEMRELTIEELELASGGVSPQFLATTLLIARLLGSL